MSAYNSCKQKGHFVIVKDRAFKDLIRMVAVGSVVAKYKVGIIKKTYKQKSSKAHSTLQNFISPQEMLGMLCVFNGQNSNK